MTEGTDILEEALQWLKENYATFRFFQERDIVWTVQTRIIEQIEESGLAYRVFNDYPMLKGRRRSLATDLAILDPAGRTEVAAEFKYEPSHERDDIPSSKFPVVFWGKDGVAKDQERIRDFVEQGKAQKAYSVFIDEGGYFRRRRLHTGSQWISWETGVWVLYAEAEANR